MVAMADSKHVNFNQVITTKKRMVHYIGTVLENWRWGTREHIKRRTGGRGGDGGGGNTWEGGGGGHKPPQTKNTKKINCKLYRLAPNHNYM